MTKTLLDPHSQQKFVNSLPIPPTINTTRSGTYVLQIRQTQQWLGLVNPAADSSGNHDPLLTTVWGYGQPGQATTYPGPTLVAQTGQPIHVMWQNKLPRTGHLLPVDTSLHMAEPVRKTLEKGYVPTVTHLHGGHSASSSDGLPEAWFTQNFSETGPQFGGEVLTYDNDQQSATLWYHDHTLGMTRLNVYAGLAGFYLLRDNNEENLVSSGVLPDRKFELGAAIQDRAFSSDGQLYLPAFADDPLPGTKDPVTGQYQTVSDVLGPDFTGTYPSIVPEFFGDFVLVNGMTWPKFDADPGEYRFHLLNGSDSRFYVLQPDNPYVKVTLIGTDGGLLPNAVTIMDGDGVQEPGEQLVLGPGQRADVIFDFSAPQLRGQSVTLLNEGPAYEPFKGLASDGSLADGVQAAQPTDPVGQVMRFNIGQVDALPNTASVTNGTVLNPNYVPLSEDSAARVRKLGLFEQTDSLGRVTPLLGVAEDTTDINGNPVPFGPPHWDDPVTETPALGTTEVWDIYNFTEDAHPIHLHLTQFQVLARHEISFQDANDDGVPDNIRGTSELTAGDNPSTDDVVEGASLPLSPMDMGLHDTVTVEPDQSVSIIAEFDRPGDYVWHCHILSHEDNEMMRPYFVTEHAGASNSGGATEQSGNNKAAALFGDKNGGIFTGSSVGNDILVAAAGNTSLLGAGAGDVLFGSASGDGNVLEAGPGAETIVEGNGATTVQGGSGTMIAFGGKGVDTYLIEEGLRGRDLIVGFKNGLDKLDLKGADVGKVLAGASSGDWGTTLRLGDGTEVVLFGVQRLDPNSLISPH